MIRKPHCHLQVAGNLFRSKLQNMMSICIQATLQMEKSHFLLFIFCNHTRRSDMTKYRSRRDCHIVCWASILVCLFLCSVIKQMYAVVKNSCTTTTGIITLLVAGTMYMF